jgi:hypothetical protein
MEVNYLVLFVRNVLTCATPLVESSNQMTSDTSVALSP